MAVSPFNTNLSPFPFTAGFAITPGTACPPTRAIYVGGNGNIQLELIGGGTVTFTSVLVGTFLHVCTTNVVAATASNLIGLQ